MHVSYRKTQACSVIVGVAGAGIIVLGNLMWAYGGNWGSAAAIVLLAAVLALFSTLTVEIVEDELKVRFGFGWPRKTIPLRTIRFVRPMEVPWYFGWGVRWIPRGWMFRGTGTAVVEIELDTGRRFCIGSPEPEALAEAIDEARGRDHA